MMVQDRLLALEVNNKQCSIFLIQGAALPSPEVDLSAVLNIIGLFALQYAVNLP